MTALTYFRTEFDYATRRIQIYLDSDAAYAVLGSRDDFQAGATRRIWNWIGNGNWLPGYRDIFGKNVNADSYATTMRVSYAFLWDHRPNGFTVDLNGVPPSAVLWPHRYDCGVFDMLSNGRDSFSADLRAFTQTWLTSH